MSSKNIMKHLLKVNIAVPVTPAQFHPQSTEPIPKKRHPPMNPVSLQTTIKNVGLTAPAALLRTSSKSVDVRAGRVRMKWHDSKDEIPLICKTGPTDL
jgi:hypothetical protein